MIAFFWDDLDLSTGGRVYAFSDALTGTFRLQFQNVRFKGTSSTVTCQVNLKTTGEIVMQYTSAAVLNSCTIGIQNGAASQGFQAAFNQSYLQPNFSIRLTPASWLQLGRNAGLIPRGNNELVELILDPAGGFGTNRATILITTGDPVYPLVTIPVELDVTRIATWRQTYFGNPADT